MRQAQIFVLATSMLTIVNCSKVDFGHNSGSGSSSSSSTAQSTTSTPPSGDSASGSVTQAGDVSNAGGAAGQITGVGNASAAVLPKVQFIGPPCERLTNCSVTFQLDKAYPDRVEFDWKTRDDLFGTAAATGAPPWGQPNVQYVPTSGHVVFSAGETSQTVYVRNINPENVPISIGVEMSSCTYNSLLESCQKFFAP